MYGKIIALFGRCGNKKITEENCNAPAETGAKGATYWQSVVGVLRQFAEEIPWMIEGFGWYRFVQKWYCHVRQ
jgi:hypothetical protein